MFGKAIKEVSVILAFLCIKLCFALRRSNYSA